MLQRSLIPSRSQRALTISSTAIHTKRAAPSTLTQTFFRRSSSQRRTMASSSNNTTPPSPTSNQPHPAPLVISGPSGAGKSTLLKRLFAQHPTRLGFSISHTTRAPRPGEQPGREYHFVTREAFAALAAAGAFLEHATHSGNSYGTSFAAVDAVRADGRVCVLDIEVQGVVQLRAAVRDARVLFVRPPGLDVLEARLRARATDDEAAIARRLEQARREMAFAEEDERGRGGVFDKVVVNDDLETCWAEVSAWVAEGLKEEEGEAAAAEAS